MGSENVFRGESRKRKKILQAKRVNANVKYIEKWIFYLILGNNVSSQKIKKNTDSKISNIFVTVTILHCKPLIMFYKKIQHDRGEWKLF